MKNTIAGSHSKVEKARCRKKERKRKNRKEIKSEGKGEEKVEKILCFEIKLFAYEGKQTTKL